MVVGIYRLTSVPLEAVSDIFENLTPFMTSEVTMIGDLNLSWKSTDSDSLNFFCAGLGLIQLISDPTHPNLKDTTKSAFIDIISTNHHRKYSSCGVLPLDIRK